MSEYKNNCVDYKAVMAVGTLYAIDPYLGEDIADTLSVNVKKADQPTFNLWKEHWKDDYNRLSQLITKVKQDRNYWEFDGREGTLNLEKLASKQAILADLKKIANTLMNARIYARDARRDLNKDAA